MHTKLATMAIVLITENTQIEKQKSAFNGRFKSYIATLISSHSILNCFFTALWCNELGIKVMIMMTLNRIKILIYIFKV